MIAKQTNPAEIALDVMKAEMEISCLSIFIKDSKVLINWQPAVFGLSASIFFIILANYVLIKNE